MTSKIFENRELVPKVWLERAGSDRVHVFNPSILRLGRGLIMAYRVVLADGSRHIAMCRLNDDWTVRDGSVSAFSDMLAYADAGEANADYHARPADPRLFDAGGRLYMHFNSGSQPTPNRIYLVAIEPGSLQPLGHAREVVRLGRRQAVEKNWLFFAHGGNVFVIYKLAPLTILRADLTGPGRVVCMDMYSHAWDSWPYEDVYGELRGGATPVMHDGRLFVVAHSAFVDERNGPGGGNLCYVGAVCVLEGHPPFSPKLFSPRPIIELTSDERSLPHLPQLDARCAEVAYPDGSAADDDGLTVSYGINNKFSALRRVEWNALMPSLVQVVPRSTELTRSLVSPDPHDRFNGGSDAGWTQRRDRMVLRSYWWKGDRLSPRAAKQTAALTLGRFVQGNFGDLSAPHLLGRLTGLAPQHHVDGPRLMSVGSLIQFARDGDVIWGTGLNGSRAEMIYAPQQLKIYATRGPISCDFLRRRGFDVSRVNAVFDPTSLIGHLFANEIEALRQQIADPPRDFIVIPHFSDDLTMRQLYPQYEDCIRSVDTPFFQMVNEILRSNLVISSSLHGLIVAEALGVPAVWHRPLMGEDELKFVDYYLGTDRHKIVRVDTLDAAFKVSPMELPKFDITAMLASFPPYDDLVAQGVLESLQPVPLRRCFSFGSALPASIGLVDGWSPPETHGIWSNGHKAVLELLVGDNVARDVSIELTVAGYVPTAGRSQHVAVSDDVRLLRSFELADQKPMTLRIPVGQATLSDGVLRLTFTITTAVSPESLGLSADTRKLGIALLTFRLLPESAPRLPLNPAPQPLVGAHR